MGSNQSLLASASEGKRHCPKEHDYLRALYISRSMEKIILSVPQITERARETFL
jgi:hypothetical protein